MKSISEMSRSSRIEDSVRAGTTTSYVCTWRWSGILRHASSHAASRARLPRPPSTIEERLQ